MLLGQRSLTQRWDTLTVAALTAKQIWPHGADDVPASTKMPHRSVAAMRRYSEAGMSVSAIDR